MNLTTFLSDALLTYLFESSSAYRPTTLYLGLSTSNPGAAGSFAGEPSGNGYARVLAFGSGVWATSALEATSNLVEFDFPQATGNWGTIGYAFIADASSAGNMLWQGMLVNSKTVTTNDIMSFGIGSITAGLS